jgi:hypothetical protein
MMKRRASGPHALAIALSASLLAGGAWAQTPAPLACPPCGANDRCVDGVCLPNPDTPPPVAAPALPEAPPPAPAVAPTPTEGDLTAPPPPPSKRRRPPPRHDEDEEVTAKATPTDEASWRRGMLVMPFAGFHAVEGIAANDYDPGFRIGALVGTHLDRAISLNLEVAVDCLSPKVGENAPRGSTTSGHDLTIAFAPLFHGSAGVGEFVVGPKLGYWGSSIGLHQPGEGDVQVSQTGWTFGLNVGGFGGLSDGVALGALFSYQMTYISQTCSRGVNVTSSCANDTSAPQILSFSLAALF